MDKESFLKQYKDKEMTLEEWAKEINNFFMTGHASDVSIDFIDAKNKLYEAQQRLEILLANWQLKIKK